ncbi:hypothetical protein OE88DRAFT_1737262 [Heliocybe sulcata]|uniref:Uncharacterized protein n=1 Tax=Heliocybe sulcata TaxID=5364 RepID=A0A5C3MVC8_9AGAM|nr:hypothetical protein OE88DRAFT_1737262 [Heliocybe sulcata]
MQPSGEESTSSAEQASAGASEPHAVEEALHNSESDTTRLSPNQVEAADSAHSPGSSPKPEAHDLPTESSEHDPSAEAPHKPMFRPRAPLKKPVVGGGGKK